MRTYPDRSAGAVLVDLEKIRQHMAGQGFTTGKVDERWGYHPNFEQLFWRRIDPARVNHRCLTNDRVSLLLTMNWGEMPGVRDRYLSLLLSIRHETQPSIWTDLRLYSLSAEQILTQLPHRTGGPAGIHSHPRLERHGIRSIRIMKISLETIQPAYADLILSGNSTNRPEKKRHIKFLADQITAGAWQVTGDPIKISTSGRVLDGQHRLKAIIMAGIPVDCYVARDCPDEIFTVLDTGINRTSSDVLAVAGQKNHTATAAAIRILLMHQQGRLNQISNGGGRVATNAQILTFAEEHDLAPFVTQAHTWVARCRLLRVGEWAALYFLLSSSKTAGAKDFLQQLSTGLNLHAGHPLAVLRPKLEAALTGRFNFSTAERMALVIKAWNAQVSGQELKQMTWRMGEDFPAVL